jgi:molybdenum cofactor guanylyltransferase
VNATIPAYILSGGRSSRFGSDKALARLEGIPLVKRLADRLAKICSSVTVVTRQGESYDELGIRSIEDQFEFWGPMAGVIRALQDRASLDSGEPWILVTSCDLLEWHDVWIDRMMQAIQNESIQNRIPSVAAFQTADDKWQPFPALYQAALLPIATELLNRGERSMQCLLNYSSVSALTVSLKGMPDIKSANTHEELQAWVAQRGPSS